MEPTASPNRRSFLRRLGRAGLALTAFGGATACYGLWEAKSLRVRRYDVPVPNLPRPFHGKKVALLADIHHGRYVGLDYVREVVARANTLRADFFTLAGDFGNEWSRNAEELPPCLAELARLDSPLGSFAVPGNHDWGHEGRIYRQSIAAVPKLHDLTNRAIRLSLGGEHLWLAGVDDHKRGRPDQAAALRGIPDGAAVVLLSHNPDFAEEHPDPRVGLVLSGHTHGGQVRFPCTNAPWAPTRYGPKYLRGLVQGPASRVFVSCGLGLAGAPVRFNVPPEICLLTLVPEAERPPRLPNA